MSGPCRGFTLVELLVALVVTSLVVLLSHQLLTAAGDSARTLVTARAALDREANARRWLASSWRSLEVGGAAVGFTGAPTEARYSSWVRTPGGWWIRTRVRLTVEGTRLVATLDDGPLVLADEVTGVGFDYLLAPGADSRWVAAWQSPASTPLAVRLRLQRAAGASGRAVVDTLLFLIGPRG